MWKGGRMRSLRIVFLLLTGILPVMLFTQTVDPSWGWQNTLPIANELREVFFTSAETGYAVDCEGGTILRTTDGGATWDIKWTIPDSLPGYYELNAIHFPNEDTGYAVGCWMGAQFQGSTNNIILRTTDAGDSWVIQERNVNPALYDVHFPVNGQAGYAVGRGGVLLKTTDAGTSWVTQSSGTTTHLYSVYFPEDDQTGYVGGWQGLIIKTTNGGADWAPVHNQGSGEPNFYVVQFPENTQTGYAVGYVLPGGGDGTILKTTNGGSNWTRIYYNGVHEIRGLWFLDNQTGYVVRWQYGVGTDIRKTTNGGSTWNDEPIDRSLDYFAGIHFPDYQTGYVVGHVYDQNGGHGQIYKTTNAGADWSHLNSGPEYPFYDVEFPVDDQIGYVCGYGGYVFKTTNSGNTWGRLVISTSNSFYGIDFLDTQIGWAVAENGMVQKTTNGGSNWTAYNVGAAATLMSVQFIDDQIGYIGGWLSGTGCVVYKTTDGGVNWTSQTIPNNSTYRAANGIHFPVDADTGYIACGACPGYGGVEGAIYKTTNGGQNWVLQYNPHANYYSVCFPVNTQTGYVGGLQGMTGDYKVVKTTNGGQNWVGQAAGPGIVPVTSLHFPVDDQIGYAVFRPGGYHMMCKTTNGGTTWEPMNSLTWHGYEGIQFIDNEIGYAVGRGGMIRKTTNGGYVWIREEERDFGFRISNFEFKICPNPFTAYTTILGYERDYFTVYDISGRKVGRYKGNNLGVGLAAGVYFVVPEKSGGKPARVVKIK